MLSDDVGWPIGIGEYVFTTSPAELVMVIVMTVPGAIGFFVPAVFEAMASSEHGSVNCAQTSLLTENPPTAAWFTFASMSMVTTLPGIPAGGITPPAGVKFAISRPPVPVVVSIVHPFTVCPSVIGLPFTVNSCICAVSDGSVSTTTTFTAVCAVVLV